MDEEERTALAAEITESVLASISPVLEALKPTAPAPVENSIGAVAEAVATAGLTAEGRAAVYERVDRGEAFAEAIVKEQTREKAVAEQLGSTPKAAKSTLDADFEEAFGYTTDDSDSLLGTSVSEAAEREFDALTSEV